MNTPFSLDGKSILVTGASSGIGRAIAIECAAMGAKIYITARNEARLNETLSMMNTEGHASVIADLTSQADRDNLLALLPELDGIVHCAGMVDPVPFQFMTEDRLKSIFELNFFSPMLFTKELLKKKKIKNNGSIVYISSIAGLLCSSPGGSMYAGTKAAINGMVKGIALDLAPKGIRVNTVCPGMIDTDIFSESGLSKEQLEEDIKRYPLKRHGKPEEVAYATIYLLSDATRWMTGSNLILDGGFTLL